jgi:pilus assembly protein CpaB
LNTKITGPGERATLSRMLREGMKAVTIQANAVAGVGGFVNPGDHVDVILTRNAGEAGTPASADILIQNIRVLGVDQSADDRKFKAAVAQTVTLEVPIRQAQRILLGASIGTLSLVLRGAGDLADSDNDRVSLADLGLGAPAQPAPPPAATAPVAAPTRAITPAAAPSSPAPSTPGWSLTGLFGGGQSGNPGAAPPKPEPKTVTIGVSRGLDRKEYRVPAQDQTVPGSRLAATN